MGHGGELGLIHLYHGDGKGKTTAAIGLAVRAAGRKKQVLIARFLKHDDSGEVMGLQSVPGITVLPCRRVFGFTFQMTAAQKAEAREYYTALFGQIKAMAEQGPQDGSKAGKKWDLLVLDEVLGAVNASLLDQEEVEQFLAAKPKTLEVVLTGRSPGRGLIELSDYVTEMKAQKHPYDRGIPARQGIEY